MDRRHKQLLERNYTALLDSIDVNLMLDCMRGSSLFGLHSEDVQRVSGGATLREKARLIIEALLRKGPNAFAFFVYALYRTIGNRPLVDKLIKEGGLSLQQLEERHAEDQRDLEINNQPVQVSRYSSYPHNGGLRSYGHADHSAYRSAHARSASPPPLPACGSPSPRYPSPTPVSRPQPARGHRAWPGFAGDMEEESLPNYRHNAYGSKPTMRAMPVSEESDRDSSNGQLVVFGRQSRRLPK